MPVNVSELQNAVVTTILSEVNSLIEGANQDIQTTLNALVQESLEAAATGQLDLLPVIEDQVKVLAEKNRIRIAKGAERFVFDVLRVALGVATKLAIPSIPTLQL